MNLAHPAWLFLWILVPILAIGGILVARFAKQPWNDFAAERLRGKLIRRAHPLPRWLSFVLLLAAIAALVGALARPQGDAGVKSEKTEGRNVMIALDLSRSMRVRDVKPDRLSQAKIVIYELLETLKDDRVGLVGFAGTSFLAAPLTIDHVALQETVEQLDEYSPTQGGSDISSAIQLATEVLKETGQKNNALILISDGEEHEGELNTIIAEAERAGVTIFAIGVGTEDGDFVPHSDFQGGFLLDRNGAKVLSTLEPNVLRKLANETGGRYVIAGRGADIPAMVELAIQGLDVFEMEGGKTRVVVEFFQWLLLPAIVFLMASIIAGTRWRKLIGPGVGLFVLFSFQDASADLPGEAKSAFQAKDYIKSRDIYRSLAEQHGGDEKAARYRLGEGLAAYEAQDYRGARGAYSDALLSDEPKVTAKGHEGIGNTLFQLGWIGIAGAPYDGGENASMEKFEAMVRDRIARMSEVDVPEKGENSGYTRFKSVIQNWTDAIRHYQSATENYPSDEGPKTNAKLTMEYLTRLAEILKEEKDELEQQMPQPGQGQEGQGQPQEGEESGEGEPQEGDGSGGEENEDGQDDGDKGDEEDDGKDGDEEKDGESGEEESESDHDDGADPNETAEERASRLLKENADLENGRLNRGNRRELRNPEKDW
ncbi:VWA domain-containing protein [Luteolibacter algae]|uniref:VWA domain-containing protein n=1 Tax=Luteolibacter algae TaxID=454151 RepID=A0ABW5D849_9BACT